MIFHKTYDPLVGYCIDKGYLDGVALWPETAENLDKAIRIFTSGNSTSVNSLKEIHPEDPESISHLMAVDRQWPTFLPEILSRKTGKDVVVFNASACGYSSSQELFRIIRDTPGVKPHIVISMSGVADMGFCHAAHPYIHTHPYQKEIVDKIIDMSPLLDEYSLGVPNYSSKPHENWSRNLDIMNYTSARSGARFYGCLQPIMGYAYSHPHTEEEENHLLKATNRKLSNRPYFDSLNEFFSNADRIIKEHNSPSTYLFSLTDVFRDVTEAVWADQRHLNNRGNELLAEQLAKIILSTDTSGLFS
jgi:hypothetical protein